MRGDLTAVAELARDKADLVEVLEAGTPQDLSELTDHLHRNAALLSAARDGVSSVLVKIHQQRKARTTLSTYDSSGKAATISHAPTATSRRF